MRKLYYIFVGILLLPLVALAATPPLTVTQGGTGWGKVQAGGILYGNSTLRLATTSQGSAGQVLYWPTSGIPAWSATTTITPVAPITATFLGGTWTVGCATCAVGGLSSYDAWTHPSAGQSATTSLMLFSGQASTSQESAYIAYFGGTATTTFFANGRVGVSSSTPFGFFSINPIAGVGSNKFVVGSSSATSLIIDNSGNVGVGTTTPTSLFSIGTAGNALRVDTTGTIQEGIWSGTAIGATKGGTAQVNVATGDILYGSNTDTWSRLGAGTNGRILMMASGIPSWVGTTTAGTGLTYNVGAPGNFSVNTSQNISTLSNLTNNGFVITTGGTGALSIQTLPCSVAQGCTNTTAFTGRTIVTADSAGTTLSATSSNPLYVDAIFASSTLVFSQISYGARIGTSTSNLQGNIVNASSTRPQECFGDGTAGDWLTCFRTSKNKFDIATSSDTSNATSTNNASLTILNGGYAGLFGIGSTSPWGILSVNNVPGQPAFAIGSSTNTSFIVDNLDRTGVATSSPWRTFDVNGTVGFKGLTTGVGAGALCLSSTNEVLFSSGADCVSNGTVTSVTGTYPISSSGGNTPAISIVATSTTYGTSTAWGTLAVNPTAGLFSNAFVVGSSSATSFVVNNGGLTGVGTTTPWALLSINPDDALKKLGANPAFAVGSSTFTSFIITNASNVGSAGLVGVGTTSPWGDFSIEQRASSTIPFVVSDSGTSTPSLLVSPRGSVGIGTTTPWASLAVNPVAAQASNMFAVGSSTGNAFLITNGGYIGIGTTSPFARLTLSNNGTIAAFTATSSLVIEEWVRASTSTAMTLSAKDGPQILQNGTSATTVTLDASTFIPGSTLKVVICNPHAGTPGTITWATSNPTNALLWTGSVTAPAQTTTIDKCDVYSFIATQATSTTAHGLGKILGAATQNF